MLQAWHFWHGADESLDVPEPREREVATTSEWCMLDRMTNGVSARPDEYFPGPSLSWVAMFVISVFANQLSAVNSTQP